MHVIPYHSQYAAQIATLLNDHLPFQPEDAQTVDAAGGIRFVALIDEQVVGYIAGYIITDYEEDFPYFKEQLSTLKDIVTSGPSVYASHFVVDPSFRKRGIGSALVEAFMRAAEQQADAIVVVGWVQSDTNKWAAERQFMQYGFESFAYMKRYFEPYSVYCPSCDGLCYCDAHIVVKRVPVLTGKGRCL